MSSEIQEDSFGDNAKLRKEREMLYTSLSSKNLLKLSSALFCLQWGGTVRRYRKKTIFIFSVVQEAGYI
jgi:hypothetical protein